MHLIAHEATEHAPINRARPLDYKGRPYDNFTYDPSDYTVFTTDGLSIQQWHTQRAAVQIYELINGVDRPFMRDGAPLYAGDVDVYLELKQETSERAWLTMTRFGNQGTFRLHDQSVGWILEAEESQLEQAFAVSAGLGYAPDFEQAA
jgi:hypothetical protein